ncbi:hypothetical protein ACFFNY_28045 [Paenibacillus hodogayensis]|uniref:Uncharacterized protein n=1 Tax=Paenibacillus hodogayensis TaxID=279208 RepID=A0ABV5W4F1_9BACL
MLREWSIRIGAVLALAAVLLAGLFETWQFHIYRVAAVSSDSALQEDQSWLFDPGSVRSGDTVAGMSAQSVQPGAQGDHTVAVQFAGTKEVSGRFRVLDKVTGDYRPGDVIFTLDERSADRLPRAGEREETSGSFALHFEDVRDKSRFGPTGSTGVGSIVISAYTAVYADKPETLTDKATLAEVRTLHVIPPRKSGDG